MKKTLRKQQNLRKWRYWKSYLETRFGYHTHLSNPIPSCVPIFPPATMSSAESGWRRAFFLFNYYYWKRGRNFEFSPPSQCDEAPSLLVDPIYLLLEKILVIFPSLCFISWRAFFPVTPFYLLKYFSFFTVIILFIHWAHHPVLVFGHQ